MAKDDPNDMTEGAADSETAATRRARERALGTNPFTPEQMADAIAKAQMRVIEEAGKAKEKPLPEIVRASVRCGYETVKRDNKVEVRPGSITFRAEETADGTTPTVPHGRPVRLKRAAFLRYQAEGRVVAG